MRRLPWLLLVIMLVACEPSTAPTTTDPVLPPPVPIETSSTTTASTTTTTSDRQQGVFAGWLPDETPYLVSFETPFPDAVEGISGGIVMDVDGSPNAIGVFQFNPGDTDQITAYEDGVYRIQAGGLVTIDFYDHILDALPPSPETAIRTGIRGDTRDDFPILRLSEPFRWASDEELPLHMEVQYRHFVVSRGCGDLAVACSQTGAIQVIPIDTQDLPLEAWNSIEVFVESPAPRPTSDPNYLDPGPLSRRMGSDLMWTGQEMIVFGGKEERDGVPTLIDAAAFDPATNAWRLLEPFPRLGSLGARAIWGDGEMLVVSTEGTLAYDPDSDTWRDIGQGLLPVEWNDRMAYLDGHLYVWDRAFSMHRMDLDIGQWEMVSAPDEIAGPTEAWAGVLRVVSDQLVAITLNSACQGNGFWRLSGESWGPLPGVSLATPEVADCSIPGQSVSLGDHLFIWDDLNHPTMGYAAASDAWSEFAPAPLGGSEGAGGAVIIGPDQFMIPEYGSGAIFDVRTEEWTHVTLPGHGTDAEIIWTGEEFLAWGIWENFDTWRWSPGADLIGGDDVS